MQTLFKAYLLIIALISFHQLHSQDYLVTTKGDTIVGEVKPIFSGVEKKVSLTTPDKKKKAYSILQVKAYDLQGKTYHTVRGLDGYTFMKLLKSGYLSLYAYQGENQSTFNVLFLKKNDGTTLEVPNLNFKKMMKNFLQDCPAVADSIENGTWTKRELDKIILEYNNCILGKSQEISAKNIEQTNKEVDRTQHWNVLEEKIKMLAAFENRNDALDMISDVKGKIARGEKIPDYLIKSLKSALSPTELLTELEQALNQTNAN